MSPYVERIVERLREAEDDLAPEVEEQQRRWHHRVHRRRVWFDQELRQAHRHLKQSIPAYIRCSSAGGHFPHVRDQSVGVTGLTAYDAQRLNAMAETVPAELAGTYAIAGALALYLDFVNRFLSLLRFFGRRRE